MYLILYLNALKFYQKTEPMSTISIENYLKAIFNHTNLLGENAGTAQLAQELSVSNAAISDMAKKLSSHGLIAYKKYKGMELTSEGEKIALRVIRRHRLWELFLIKVLDMPLSEVHDQAEKLEHHASEILIDKIDEFLGYPEFDPHGHPIPKKNGSLPKSQKFIPLANAEENLKYQVVQINDRDNKLVNYLSEVDLVLNTQFKVIGKLEFDRSLLLQIGGKTLSISQKISENIYVRSFEK